MSNAMLWFVGTQDGKTRGDYAAEIEQKLKDMIDTEDPDRKIWMEAIKAVDETNW